MSTRSGCRYQEQKITQCKQNCGFNSNTTSIYCDLCLFKNKLNNAIEKKRIKDEYFKLIPNIVRSSCRNAAGVAGELWNDWNENNIFFTAKQARELWNVVTQIITNDNDTGYQYQFAHAIFSRMVDFWNLDEEQDLHVGFCYYSMNRSIPKDISDIKNFTGMVDNSSNIKVAKK